MRQLENYNINELAAWRKDCSGIHQVSPQWDGEVEYAGRDCARLALVAIEQVLNEHDGSAEDAVKAVRSKIEQMYDAPVVGYKFAFCGPTRFLRIDNWDKGPINYFEVLGYKPKENALLLRAYMDSPVFKGTEDIEVNLEYYDMAVRHNEIGRYYDEESESKSYRYDGRRA